VTCDIRIATLSVNKVINNHATLLFNDSKMY